MGSGTTRWGERALVSEREAGLYGGGPDFFGMDYKDVVVIGLGALGLGVLAGPSEGQSGALPGL